MINDKANSIARTTKVAIQGVAGCFHDAAAREYFMSQHGMSSEAIESIECRTFNDMFDRIDADPMLAAIVAIENTIAGPLLQNHELLRKSNCTIIGEHKMRISHVLCALPGETIENIREVHSHPMALMQCEEFLHSHPGMRMVETFDTAGSAKMIADSRLRGHAAICGEFAARLYGLDILAQGIETNKRNFTRFLVITDPLNTSIITTRENNCNKASIVFTLPHSQGALSKVLTILSFYDMNLTKIQSTPIIGREWEYRFYIDLTFDSHSRYIKAIDAVRPLMSQLKTLGEYREYEY